MIHSLISAELLKVKSEGVTINFNWLPKYVFEINFRQHLAKYPAEIREVMKILKKKYIWGKTITYLLQISPISPIVL